MSRTHSYTLFSRILQDRIVLEDELEMRLLPAPAISCHVWNDAAMTGTPASILVSLSLWTMFLTQFL